MMSHPLDEFKFCPVCGSSRFEVNNFKSKRCHDCGFTYYANPCSATAAFIVNDRQEMLVVRRAKEPAKGTLDVVDIQYLFSSPNVYEYSGIGIHTLDMDFLVRVHGDIPPVKAADDAAEALWIPLQLVNPSEFGLTSIRNAVIRFLKEKKQL